MGWLLESYALSAPEYWRILHVGKRMDEYHDHKLITDSIREYSTPDAAIN